jgi:hypothetical protein
MATSPGKEDSERWHQPWAMGEMFGGDPEIENLLNWDQDAAVRRAAA